MGVAVLVLAVLLLAGLLFGVAAVAVGHGSPLSETAPDRRSPVLPPDRVAPPDIDAVRFSMALRGYRMDEVDEVLDRLSTEISVRDAEISRLRAGAGSGPEASYQPQPEPSYTSAPPNDGELPHPHADDAVGGPDQLLG